MRKFTAEEARQKAATINGYDNWSQMMNADNLTDIAKTVIADICMRDYAYLIAKSILIDAADNLQDNFSALTYYEQAYSQILKTPINTP